MVEQLLDSVQRIDVDVGQMRAVWKILSKKAIRCHVSFCGALRCAVG